MPVYEYECQSCKEITETWQGISEDPLKICPACQGPVQKIISMSTFALKGKGWFADGYNNTSTPCKSSECASSPGPKCPKSGNTTCSSC